MDPLKMIFESTVLNDDTKDAIRKSFDALVEAEKVKLESEFNVKLEEAQQQIMDSLPATIEEAVAEELAAVAEEVAGARTLEVEYAEKLNTFKESFAEKQEEVMKVMVEESVAEVVEEMQDEIELAKKHQFTMKLFESFKDSYEVLFGGSDISAVERLAEAEAELDGYKRKEKLDELLEGIVGEKRNIAQTILEGTSTDKLEDKFNGIRQVLLSESKKEGEEVIKEGEEGKEEEITGTVVLDESVKIDESEEEKNPLLERLQRSIRNVRG